MGLDGFTTLAPIPEHISNREAKFETPPLHVGAALSVPAARTYCTFIRSPRGFVKLPTTSPYLAIARRTKRQFSRYVKCKYETIAASPIHTQVTPHIVRAEKITDIQAEYCLTLVQWGEIYISLLTIVAIPVQ